ncbi:hypothetical protein GA0115246_114175 [Streptomyces sp. SolWspMP-sol7th]|nr:hypothetical protein GA0115246_114175 [Streptomyces sp. SolWspMP-sol7th]
MPPPRPAATGSSSASAARSSAIPAPRERRAVQHGVDPRRRDRAAQFPAQAGGGEAAVEVRAEQRVVPRGQHLGERLGVCGLVRRVREETRPRRPGPVRHAQRDDRRVEPCPQLAEQLARPAPVDLVDEEQRGDAEPPQRAQQYPRLRLHPLDGGDDEDGPVEHREDPLHLRDEIRVARGVHEVDGAVAEREGDDGRLDGDPAPPLQVEGVGTGRARVDAAGLVEQPGGVQESLGQAGLTGVDVGEDAEVEMVVRVHPGAP